VKLKDRFHSLWPQYSSEDHEQYFIDSFIGCHLVKIIPLENGVDQVIVKFI